MAIAHPHDSSRYQLGMECDDGDRDLEGEIIAPQSTKRKGPEPGNIKAGNFFDEVSLCNGYYWIL